MRYILISLSNNRSIYVTTLNRSISYLGKTCRGSGCFNEVVRTPWRESESEHVVLHTKYCVNQSDPQIYLETDSDLPFFPDLAIN